MSSKSAKMRSHISNAALKTASISNKPEKVTQQRVNVGEGK